MYERLTLNLTGGPTVMRRETLNGRQHLVVPTVILKHDVLEGSNGAFLYEGSENRRWTSSWNHKPLVAYHPEMDGKPISACDPSVLEARGIGLMLNGRTDEAGTTSIESWIDVDRCKSVDNRILSSLEKGEKVEVSTGLELDLDFTPGEHNGKKYVAVARNYRPDHLAALPDRVGALSVKDGGGMLQLNEAREPESTRNALRRGMLAALKPLGAEITGNELSFSTINRKLSDLLSYSLGEPGKYWPGFVYEVYADRVIFCDGSEPGGMWSQKYKTDGDSVSLVGKPEKVERVVEYRTSDGTSYVGNGGQLVPKVKETVVAFDKKAHIDRLIANGHWTEAERKWLDDQPESVLQKLLPIEKKEEKKEETTQNVTTNTTAAPTQPTKPNSFQEWLNGAPAEYRDVVQNGVNSYNAERDALITRITANTKNPPSKEFFAAKPIEELRWLAEQVRPATTNGLPAGQVFAPHYYGAQGAPVVNAAEVVPQDVFLAPPSMDYEAAGKK